MFVPDRRSETLLTKPVKLGTAAWIDSRDRPVDFNAVVNTRDE